VIIVALVIGFLSGVVATALVLGAAAAAAIGRGLNW
jgi:hypothetical protein